MDTTVTAPSIPYSELLARAIAFAESLGLIVQKSSNLDPYYKGDLDGKNIWISADLSDEEDLFNLLHMTGHCIQWNTDEEEEKLGCVLHMHPDDALLRRLQEYEWEANCFAYTILLKIGGEELSTWLYENYKQDMLYLTNFYLTGEKLKEVTPLALAHAFIQPFIPKPIPAFTPHSIEGSRNGIVIDFSKKEAAR